MLSVIMLSVIMFVVIMLSVIMLSVIRKSVIMLSVIMLSVVAPLKQKTKCYKGRHDIQHNDIQLSNNQRSA